jgi:hypothetical protein
MGQGALLREYFAGRCKALLTGPLSIRLSAVNFTIELKWTPIFGPGP